MDDVEKIGKARHNENTHQPLRLLSVQQSSSSSLAEPELIQKPKRLKLNPHHPPPQPQPPRHTPVSNIGPPPNSSAIQSTEEALAAQLRLMTPNERAAFKRQPIDVKGKQEHRAGLFWNRPGPSPLGPGPTPTPLIVPIPNIPSPYPPPSIGHQSVINFGPYAPSGSSNSQRSESDSKKSIIKIRIIPPKPIPQPEPVKKGLLLPYQFTYLRPRPNHRPPQPEPKALMGPPEPRINIETPYKTVKKALTSLKSELGLTTYPNLTYSLSKISPKSCSSVEEVIMELDEFVFSISETSSSDEMKAMLMLFQRRLGLPAWPPFYNMLWFSAADLLDHLGDNFLFDRLTDDDDDDD